ncbi:MAG: hypothetical protein ACO28X_01915 [Ilumatobacteraceae bacterium]
MDSAQLHTQPDNVPDNDPVVVRRNAIDRWNKVASRTGYGLYVVSVLAFFGGLWTSFTSALHFVSGVALVVGSVILAPAIVITYGIRAARREDQQAASTKRSDVASSEHKPSS